MKNSRISHAHSKIFFKNKNQKTSKAPLTNTLTLPCGAKLGSFRFLQYVTRKIERNHFQAKNFQPEWLARFSLKPSKRVCFATTLIFHEFSVLSFLMKFCDENFSPVYMPKVFCMPYCSHTCCWLVAIWH